MTVRRILPCLLPLPLILSGCHSRFIDTPKEQAATEQRAEANIERQQLDEIPPPAKSRFMAVRNIDSWENPSITVQAGMLQLRVTMADPNPSPIGAGGMLRPIGAREQELNISMSKLGEAVSSIPQSAWPYGRVVALEEARKVPRAAEPQVRRNLEAAVGTLSDLGIIVYDPDDGIVR